MTDSGETETRLRALARKLEALSAVGAPTSERARVRSEHARVLRAVDAEQALENALLALAEAKSIEAEEPEETRARTIAACEATVAICFQTLGDDASALEHALSGLEALGDLEDDLARFRLHNAQAVVYLNFGQADRALASFAEAREAAVAPAGRNAALGAQHEHRVRLPGDPRPARPRDPASRPRARDRGRRADCARLGAAGARPGPEPARRARAGARLRARGRGDRRAARAARQRQQQPHGRGRRAARAPPLRGGARRAHALGRGRAPGARPGHAGRGADRARRERGRGRQHRLGAHGARGGQRAHRRPQPRAPSALGAREPGRRDR